jgi:hypothetical protein
VNLKSIEQILLVFKHLPHQFPILVALPPIDRLVASPVQFAVSPLPPAQMPVPPVKIQLTYGKLDLYIPPAMLCLTVASHLLKSSNNSSFRW